MNEQIYSVGDRILYRGIVGEVTSIGIYDRYERSEHYGYTIELCDGREVKRVTGDQLMPYQSNLF